MNTIAQYLGLVQQFEDHGVFNFNLERDSTYCLNIKLLQDSNIPEFVNSESHIIGCFQQILEKLRSANLSNNNFNEAIRQFPKGECNEICLGFSNGGYGRGLGYGLVENILSRAKKIIDTGTNNPDIFFLVPLFVPGVGSDMLSDMVGSIIKNDLKNYTIRIMNDLSITKENFPEIDFRGGLIVHPIFNKKCVLFVPSEFVHHLPVDLDYIYPDRFLSNYEAREGANSIISEAWKKLNIAEKKDEIFKITQNPTIFDQILTGYSQHQEFPYDFNVDIVGDVLLMKESDKILQRYPYNIFFNAGTFEQRCFGLIKTFQKLIEETEYKELFYCQGSKRGIAFALRYLVTVFNEYSNHYNFEIKSNFIKNYGKIVFNENGRFMNILVKLLENSQVVNGLKNESEKNSGIASDTRYYIVINLGDSDERLSNLNAEFTTLQTTNTFTPRLIVIDAKRRGE